jgi:predicted 3-demethylubiquinone-9 3-methyltransferase (glyoxalase superfamily)
MIWEKITKERGETFVVEMRNYLKRCEDIDMGWVNVRWGISLNVGPQHYFPLDATNVFD